MTDYTKSVNFATKDSLITGDPLKIVKGAEINTELDNIAASIATKLDKLVVPIPDSYVRLNTANGYGSTNTMIRRFTNIVNQGGVDITYADSATLGGSFTINTSGTYSMSYSDQFTGIAGLGFSINSATLTTGIGSIAVAEILGVTQTPAANQAACASFSGYIAAGSVVRAHTGGAASGTQTNFCQFSIARVN